MKQDWYFTFGFKSPYRDNYIIIHGEEEEARQEMFRRFDKNWAFQYKSACAAGVDKWGLQRLPNDYRSLKGSY